MIVRNSNDECVPFERAKITNSLIKELELKEFKARQISRSIKERVDKIDTEEIIGTDEIRDMVYDQLVKRGMLDKAREYRTIGVPVHELRETIKTHDRANANMAKNPETIHKNAADKVMKQLALACLPSELEKSHLNGELHVHDLEYFPARSINCLQHDLRFFIRNGLKVDGTGEHTSVAGPANNIETLVNHAGQILMASQVNMSGGQSLPLLNVFMAPYAQGLSYERIKQAMQMFIFNLNMSYTSRGGQSLTYDAPLIVKNEDNKINIINIGEFVENWKAEKWKTLSLNIQSGKYEWKNINNVYKHQTETPIIKTRLHDGREVKTTTDHSLFTFDEEANIIETKPSDELDTILTAKEIDTESIDLDISDDELFVIGLIIGDGNLADNNGNKDSAVNLSLDENDIESKERVSFFINGFSKAQWKNYGRGFNQIRIPTSGFSKYIREIGRLSPNKKIPEDFLTLPLERLKHLLDGLFSSDGSKNRNRLGYDTTSVTLINQLQFILLRFGYEFGYYVRRSESNFEANYSVHRILISAKDSWKIDLTCKKKQCFDNLSISQQRHDYSIIKPSLGRPKRLPNGEKWKYRNQWWKGNKLKYWGLEANSYWYEEIWNKVKSSLPMEVGTQEIVEKEEFVYDISVQDNENFVLANGIVAHNSVFSSVNVELDVPKFLEDEIAWGPGGKQAGVYGDYSDEARILQKAFTEVLAEGDALGKPHLFPNPIYTMRKEFLGSEYDEDLSKIFEFTAKYFTPYFANVIPDWTGGHSNVMGCRTRLNKNWTGDDWDKDTLRTGNLAYVSLNLPRLSYKGDIYENIDPLLQSAEEILLIRREHSLKLLNKHKILYFLTQPDQDGTPYYRIENSTLSFGMVGLNEMLLAEGIEDGIASKEGQKEGIALLKYINDYTKELTEETGYRWTVLQTPGETTAHRFAMLDKQRYGKEAIANGEKGSYYYTNSTHVNPSSSMKLTERIKIEEKYHPLTSGGHIFHAFLGEDRPDPEALGSLTRKTLLNSDLGFLAYTGAFSYCFRCNNYMRGLQEECPKCNLGDEIEWFSRITGYYQAVGHKKDAMGGWNAGKQAELKDRHEYNVPS